MATAYRIQPEPFLNAAEIEACQRYEAEQAFEKAKLPTSWRSDWIRAFIATLRGFAASDAGSQALKAENRRRSEEQYLSYIEEENRPLLLKLRADNETVLHALQEQRRA
jgi:hypothetical protein